MIQELKKMIDEAVEMFEAEGDTSMTSKMRVVRFRLKCSMLLRLDAVSPGLMGDIENAFVGCELQGQRDTLLEHYARLLHRLVLVLRRSAAPRTANQSR